MEDRKINTVWSHGLTEEGTKKQSASSLMAGMLLTPVLWPALRWHGHAGFWGAFLKSWKIIALQYCVGFCHTSTWISYRYFKLVRSQPSSPSPAQPSFYLPPFTIPLGKVPILCPTLLTPPPTFSSKDNHLSNSFSQIYLGISQPPPPSLYTAKACFRKTCFFT